MTFDTNIGDLEMQYDAENKKLAFREVLDFVVQVLKKLNEETNLTPGNELTFTFKVTPDCFGPEGEFYPEVFFDAAQAKYTKQAPMIAHEHTGQQVYQDFLAITQGKAKHGSLGAKITTLILQEGKMGKYYVTRPSEQETGEQEVVYG